MNVESEELPPILMMKNCHWSLFCVIPLFANILPDIFNPENQPSINPVSHQTLFDLVISVLLFLKILFIIAIPVPSILIFPELFSKVEF